MQNDKNTIMWIIIAAVLLLFFFSWFGMNGYGMMGFGFPFMFLFWIAVIWIIVTLINPGQTNKEKNSEPLAILKERYASGKITKKRYEEMKKDIEE